MIAETERSRDRVVVVGASGGIGQALADAAEARGAVIRLSRPAIDARDEATIAAAAERAGDGLTHVIVAAGLLHARGQGPERDWRQISADWMLESFRVNTVLPALVAKHFLPRLRRDGPSLFAVLTARVGSIGDNRLGGWHAYRASKAALNMILRNLAVEMGRSHPKAVIAGLHPGTVDTGLSAPFQKGVAEGRLFTADHSAERLLAVLSGLTPADSGGVFAWDGARVPE